MSLATIFDTIETDVLNFVQSAEAKAETWFKTFTPVVEADVAAAWTQFKPVILGLIVGLEQAAIPAIAAGTGFDKLGAAVAGLIAAAGAQGVTIAKTTATTVIQQAVTSLGNANTTTNQLDDVYTDMYGYSQPGSVTGKRFQIYRQVPYTEDARYRCRLGIR